MFCFTFEEKVDRNCWQRRVVTDCVGDDWSCRFVDTVDGHCAEGGRYSMEFKVVSDESCAPVSRSTVFVG
jgi:hypothetical protein